MTVIFKEFTVEAVTKASNFVKKNKILARFTAFVLVASIALVVSVVSCGITLGYNVKYSGKTVAVIGQTSVYDSAKEKVVASVNSEKCAKQLVKPEFSLTITTNDNLCNENKLADIIIENTDGITFSTALTVNGDVVAYGERAEMEKLMNDALCKYYVKGADNTSAFVDEVNVTEGYCLTSDIKSNEELTALVAGLKVKTVSTITKETAVKFTTKTVYTNKQERGYEKVETDGVKGLATQTTVIESVNGKPTIKTVVAREVVKEPVQKVVVKGTAPVMATATTKSNAKSAGYIRPMRKGDVKKVSAYWGDGRGHKGIDLAGDVGAPIFAAKAGKVVSSGWDGAYGYAVVIDHGNGYKTRYAHASALCVKKGETVTQGQQIAKVGNTGRSTGPHLHFEILKNGNQINPAPYIGY